MTTSRSTRMSRRHRWRLAVGLAVVLQVSVGCALAPNPARPGELPSRDGVQIDRTGRDDLHGSSYVFMWPSDTDPALPSGWFDTCTPVRYRISSTDLPPNGAEEIREAVQRIAAATGLRFIELPSVPDVPQKGYGRLRDSEGRFPPILFAWTPKAGTDLFDGQTERTEGYGGHLYVNLRDGTKRFVTGFIVVDRAYADRASRGFGRPTSTGQLWLHELGHVVGLTHTTDDTQAMYPTLKNAVGYGAGDLTGMRILSQMPCRTQDAAAVTSGN